MIHPTELVRLAFRIERLEQMNTHGWQGGDGLDFRNRLPGGRDTRRRLPFPYVLKGTPNDHQITESDYRLWLQTCLDLEGLAHRNDPRNPQRIVRDLIRGKLPGMR